MAAIPTAPREPTVASIALADLVATAVLAVDGVVRLDGGGVGEFATYGGGHRVPGVRFGRHVGDPTEVRVVAAYGWQLQELAADVRGAVHTVLDSHGGAPTVTVRIVDLAVTHTSVTHTSVRGRP